MTDSCLQRPFLTDFDSRGGIKGSRDPLGIQSIWTRLGRHIIGNLSTVSTSVRDFTVLTFGYHVVARVASEGDSRAGSAVETFLKWEQLAAYARAAVTRDFAFRGVERVRRNLDEASTTISAEVRHQILGSQKLYGIWGLYSVPARSSGMLDGDPARLTAPAEALVEADFLPRLSRAGFRNGDRLVQLLGRASVRLEVSGRDLALLEAVADLIGGPRSPRECAFYRDHLLHGGPRDSTQGRQRLLAELLVPKLEESRFPWSPSAVRALAKEAEARGGSGQELAWRLRRIADAETLLAPASMVFGYLLGCRDTTVEEVARRLQDAWGSRVSTVGVGALTEVQAELGGENSAWGRRWLRMAEALADGDYVDLVRLLLVQNQAVVESRGGAGPWVEEQNGKLRVRMQDERGRLPDRGQLPSLWQSPYFLDALAAIGLGLKEAGRG